MLDDSECLYRIASLYYEQNLSQEEIARIVSMSRPQISRALSKALMFGIVEIKVNLPISIVKLQENLERSLGLRKVIVAPNVTSTGNDADDRLDDIARYGARFLEKELDGRTRIGIGWGKTVYRTIKNIRKRSSTWPEIVPLIGSLGFHEPQFQVNTIVDFAASRMGGTPCFYNVSGIKGNSENNGSQVEYIRSIWKNLEVAVVGLGVFGKHSSFPAGSYSQQDIETLMKNDAVGDILGMFFNEKGYIDCYPEGSYTGIPVEDRRNAGEVICLCGGSEKIPGMAAAARDGLYDVLVTDAKSAAELESFIKE